MNPIVKFSTSKILSFPHQKEILHLIFNTDFCNLYNMHTRRTFEHEMKGNGPIVRLNLGERCWEYVFFYVLCDFVLNHIGFGCVHYLETTVMISNLPELFDSTSFSISLDFNVPFWKQITYHSIDTTYILDYYVCDGHYDCPDGVG